MTVSMERWKEAQDGEFTDWEYHRQQKDNDYFMNPFIHMLRQTYPFNRGVQRLEIGAGPHNSYHIIDLSLIGIDPLAAKYKKAGWKKYYTPIVASGEYLPFRDESWNIVYFLNVLDHATNHKEILREIHRILKKDGTCYFYTDIRESGFKDRLHFALTQEYVMNLLNEFFNTEDIKVTHAFTIGFGKALQGRLYKKVWI